MNDELQAKYHRLPTLIHECGSVGVSYSGGVDSALVALVASRELGERALACIGTSPSYPKRELDAAVELAEKFNIRHKIVVTSEQDEPRYAENGTDRCYFCKAELFNRLGAVAEDEGAAVICDGANADDVGEHRPGLIAGRERGVLSPLREAKITKTDVRELAHHLEMPIWNKPAMACLASRVPHGMPVQPLLLAKIERAEDVLASLGFKQFRVRHHDYIARIELAEEDLVRAVELRDQIVEPLLELGYKFISLDLGGFRSGSLSAVAIESKECSREVTER